MYLGGYNMDNNYDAQQQQLGKRKETSGIKIFFQTLPASTSDAATADLFCKKILGCARPLGN